jgi:hypothetical protein
MDRKRAKLTSLISALVLAAAWFLGSPAQKVCANANESKWKCVKANGTVVYVPEAAVHGQTQSGAVCTPPGPQCAADGGTCNDATPCCSSNAACFRIFSTDGTCWAF